MLPGVERRKRTTLLVGGTKQWSGKAAVGKTWHIAPSSQHLVVVHKPSKRKNTPGTVVCRKNKKPMGIHVCSAFHLGGATNFSSTQWRGHPSCDGPTTKQNIVEWQQLGGVNTCENAPIVNSGTDDADADQNDGQSPQEHFENCTVQLATSTVQPSSAPPYGECI